MPLITGGGGGSIAVPTKTSSLTNDGADGINPYIDNNDLITAVTQEAEDRQAQIDELNSQIVDTNAVLAGAVIYHLAGEHLTRDIGGTTLVPNSLIPDGTPWAAGKTILRDDNGTIGDIVGYDGTNYTCHTMTISPISADEPTLLGNVATYADLPLTQSDCLTTFGRNADLDDYARVIEDANSDNATVEYYITAIDTSGNITWGNPVILNTSNYQAQTGAADSGLLLTGGATPGTFGSSVSFNSFASTTTPKADSTAAAIGTDTGYARGDHVHPRAEVSTACDTDANIADKVVSCNGYSSLNSRMLLTIKFNKGNTVASPTINLNGLGACPIWYRGSAWGGTIAAGAIHTFFYTGGTWQFIGDLYPPARLIDGMIFDGSKNIAHFADCGTAADVAAKTVSNGNYATPVVGTRITVRFLNGNSVYNPTLNISGLGALPITYHGAGNKNYIWDKNATYAFEYTGTAWVLVGDINPPIWSDVEMLTGETWNGKPVYMLSKSGTISTPANQRVETIIVPATSTPSEIVDFKGNIKLADTLILQVGDYDPDAPAFARMKINTSGQILLRSMSPLDRLNLPYNVSVKYTKT